MSVSIREQQTSAVKSMLNLGKVVAKKSVVEPEWKLLVYDQTGQDIISPLLSVADLRSLGVTLYLSLHTNRDEVPDVAAVYFVSPTDENIARICQDMKSDMYDSYYFNFISAIPRHKLEELASAALEANVEAKVTKIFDQYVDFISLEKDMFVLNGSRDALSYYNLNKSTLKDHEMMSIVDNVVNSLYCVFVTLGTIPIIRCQAGNVAEMVAEKLDKRLRENLRDTRNSFFSAIPSPAADMGQQVMSFQRPLLLIADRNIDLATPLHHTWTYQALVHDLLNLRLNSVTVPESIDEDGLAKKQTGPKAYNLGPTNKFWQQHKGNPFPAVAEAVQEEIEEYKNHEEEVQRLKTTMGLEGGEGVPVDISDNTAKLTNAMSSLPELLEKKRLIDMHTTIATSILSCIKERKLDEYFELEEKIMNKLCTDKAVMDFLNEATNNNAEDKMRLFLIHYMCHSQNFEIDVDQFVQLLKDSGCNIAPFTYIKRWKQFTMPVLSTTQQARGGGTKTIGMFSHLMNTGSQFVMEGVKNLVIKKHNLPITKILDQLMELKANSDTDNYRYFDPKLARAGDALGRKTKVPYNNAVVFVVGGGNYIEYHNLMEYMKGKPGKQISYGCMELLNAKQFIKQLTSLGEELQVS